MSDSYSEDSDGEREEDVLFEAPFGDFPKLLLYGGVPFLLVVSTILFVCASQFPKGRVMKAVNLPPDIAARFVAPGIWGLCLLLIILQVYRRLNPQRVVITSAGLLLPKGRFSSDEVQIRWGNLEASFFAGGVKFQDIYEVTCIDRTTKTKIRIASMLFRNFDDFATFALIVGKHFGEDWSIRGFLPGKIRGHKEHFRTRSNRPSGRRKRRDED